MRRGAPLAALPLALSALTGCDPVDDDGDDAGDGDVGETGSNCDDDGASPMSDCEPYEGTQAGTTIDDSWPMVNESRVLSITAPDDPGGGIIRIALRSSDADTVPGIKVTGGGDTSGAIVGGTAAGTDETDTKYVAFAAAPGVTYTLDTQSSGPSDRYPIDFSLDWQFTSFVDCWEPNDSVGEAARIVLGEPVNAYAHAGYRSNGLTASPFVDWYEVTLDAPGTLSAELTTLPAGHRVRIRVYDDPDAPPVAGDGQSAPGEAFRVETGELKAGSYYVVVEAADSEAQTQADAQPDPESWSTPYTLEVTAS